MGPLEGDWFTLCHVGETLTKVSPSQKRKRERLSSPYTGTKERPHEHTQKVLSRSPEHQECNLPAP